MNPQAVKVEIPQPPALLPPKLQAEWKRIYREGYEQAVIEEGRDYMGLGDGGGTYLNPEDDARRHQRALRAANRMLATPPVSTYEDAMALEDWQVIFRQEEAGLVKVVTIDGKKYSFTQESTPTAA